MRCGMWQGHKALLFCQTQQMLDIVEDMCRKEGYNYYRMDGSTGVGCRGRLIRDFNENENVFLFLLTTRVRSSSPFLSIFNQDGHAQG